jgi:hypothetical protein
MIAIIKYLNSSLRYFSRNILGGSSHLNGVNLFLEHIFENVAGGPQIYEDAKIALDAAIQEFDQAIFSILALLIIRLSPT